MERDERFDDSAGFPSPLEDSPRHGFQGDRAEQPPSVPMPAGLSIAVSREAGARGGTIGRQVGRRLGWQVYDQELLEYVAQEGPVQQVLSDDLSEDAGAWVEQRLQTLIRKGHLDDTPAIVNLARLGLGLGARGKVVVVGRGAGFLLPRATTLHVRLVAPLEDRVAYMSQCLRLTPEEARQRVRVRDARRTEYLTTHLRRQPSDVYGYDMVLNTSSLGEDLCAELIIRAARTKSAQQFGTEDDTGQSLPHP